MSGTPTNGQIEAVLQTARRLLDERKSSNVPTPAVTDVDVAQDLQLDLVVVRAALKTLGADQLSIKPRPEGPWDILRAAAD